MRLIDQTIRGIRIERRLARGGMGEVYLGFHQKLKRQVAVKTLREGKQIKSNARARFLREARALSRVDHPHICKIYDYLEDPEGDLLVLEYIDGTLLRRYIAEKPSREDRFQSALQLADALAAAHDAGVIHRDVKPGNIMISPEGDIKVLDFGISRLDYTHEGISGDHKGPYIEESTSDAAHTADGSLLGTLAYMSPEQARGDDISAASDMYSLGLTLQELFSGEEPFDRGQPFAAMLRRVGAGESRGFHDPDEDLVRLVNRMKSGIPEARPSARDALERLRDIAAAPIRRRRRHLLSAAAVFLFTVAMVMTWQAWRINQEAERANDAAQRAVDAAATTQRVSEFMLDLFEMVDPDGALGKNVTAMELLDRGRKRLDSFDDRPLEQARLKLSIGKMYRKLGLYEKAEPLLKQAQAVLAEKLGNTLDVADANLELAELYLANTKLEEAERLALDALAIRRAVMGNAHLTTAKDLVVLAEVRWQQGDRNEALRLGQEALTLRELTLPPEDPEIGMVLAQVGAYLDFMGQNSKARPINDRAVAILRKSDKRLSLVEALNNIGMIHSQEGRHDDARIAYDEALEMVREALGDMHPRTSTILNNVAVLYANMGDFEKSLVYQEQANAIVRELFGPDDPTLGKGIGNVAQNQIDLGYFQKGINNIREAIRIAEKNAQPGDSSVAWEYLILAQAHAFQGDFAASDKAWRYALELTLADGDAELELIGYNMEYLAEIMLEKQNYGSSEQLYRQVNQWWEGSADPELFFENLAGNYENLATIFDATQRKDEAAQMREQAEHWKEKAAPDG